MRPPVAISIKPPRTHRTRDFFLMMGVQFVSYLNLTFNFRAVAHEQYAVIALSDGAAVAIGYFIIRRIIKSEDGWGLGGMVVGGAAAGVVGTYLTRGWG